MLIKIDKLIIKMINKKEGKMKLNCNGLWFHGSISANGSKGLKVFSES